MPDRTLLSGTIKPVWGVHCCGGLQGEVSLHCSRPSQCKGRDEGERLRMKDKTQVNINVFYATYPGPGLSCAFKVLIFFFRYSSVMLSWHVVNML